MSPTCTASGATGSTVHNCPDPILPAIALPFGRDVTVSPACSRAMYDVAHRLSFHFCRFLPYPDIRCEIMYEMPATMGEPCP